jgi:hypothetical protein
VIDQTVLKAIYKAALADATNAIEHEHVVSGQGEVLCIPSLAL